MPNVIIPRPALWKPPAGSVIDHGHPLARNLLSSWDGLEGGGLQVQDALGVRPAAFNGDMRWAPDRAGQNFSSCPANPDISGAGDYLEVADDARYDGAELSVEMWFRTTVGYSPGIAWAWGRDDGATRSGWEFISVTGGDLRFSINGLVTVGTDVPLAIYNDGRWHHAVGNIDTPAGVNNWYFDGVKRGGDTLDSTFTTAFSTVTRWSKSLDGFWQPWGALWGPCRWRTKTLRAEDVRWLYQEPFAMFRGPEIMRRYWVLGILPLVPANSSHTKIMASP